MEHSMISIIFPLFNERENVIHYNQDLFPVIDAIGKRFGESFEFIFVDDGSGDDTVEKIEEMCAKRSDIKILPAQKIKVWEMQ